MLFCRLLIFFFQYQLSRNAIQVANNLDPDQTRLTVGPDLGRNHLHMFKISRRNSR